MGSGATRVLAALTSGLVFGLGLAVSGMMNPAKIIGFLDVAGDWDPTLVFVIGSALLVAALGTGLAPDFAFVVAMLVGMGLHTWLRGP
jgi:uncharacterized membrane protein YedE/YeeE